MLIGNFFAILFLAATFNYVCKAHQIINLTFQGNYQTILAE